MADAQAPITDSSETDMTADAQISEPVADAPAADKPADDVAAPVDEVDDLMDGKVTEAPKVEEINYELKAPEGMELDSEMVEQFKPMAKELGLNNENAQKVVDFYTSKIMPRLAAQQAQVLKTMQQQWASEAKADPEFGGANLQTSLQKVARGRDWLGSEFASEIKRLGIGNNPVLLKGFAKLGRALSEDAPIGGAPASVPKDMKAVLYPEQSKG